MILSKGAYSVGTSIRPGAYEITRAANYLESVKIHVEKRFHGCEREFDLQKDNEDGLFIELSSGECVSFSHKVNIEKVLIPVM